LRISAVALALLIFTKNEGLALYAPIIALVIFFVAMWDTYKKNILPSHGANLILLYAITDAFVLVPWLIFKWTNGLPFGNAKSVSGLGIGWQEGVLQALYLNLFFNGNWIFLFPLLIALLIISRKLAWKSPLIIITGFILLAMFAQIGIFLFTSLSVEAIMGTGYSRGIIQLIPLIVFLCIMLFPKSLLPSQKEEI